MSFDEAKEEQKNMLEKINELKKRINLRTGPKPKDSNKKKESLLADAEDLYNFKNKIINTIKKEMKGSTESDEQTEETEETEEPDLSWTYKPYNEVEKLVSGKIDMINKIKKSTNTSYIKPYAEKLSKFFLKLFGEKFENSESVYDDYNENTKESREKNTETQTKTKKCW